MSIRSIGVLLFDEAELLDFAGPIQVFSSLAALYPDIGMSLRTIGLASTHSVSKLGMTVNVDETIDNAGENDLLIIPGGIGTRELIKDAITLPKIKSLIARSKHVATVCTGSLVLAKLGLLSKKRATTHFAATDILTKLDPTIIIDRSKRYFDHGQVIVAEGVSAGIDMSFYLVEKWFGKEESETVRKYIEYYPEKQ